MNNKENILTLETRRKIYQMISKYPGLHLRELARKIDIPKSTLVYHIHYLQKKNIISSSDSKGYDRFFISENFNKKNKDIIAVIREKVPLNLILYFCIIPSSNQKDIVAFAEKWEKHHVKIPRTLKKHPTTLAFHLNKLIELGLIDRIQYKNEVIYTLKDHELIFDLLITYKNKLFGKDVKKVLYYMQDPQNLSKIVDRISNQIFDVFPHPYYF